MNRINDFGGLQVATPLVDAEEGRKETNIRTALYKPAVPFQPALRRSTVMNAPNAGPIPASDTSTLVASSIATASPAVTPGGKTTLPNVDTMPFFIQQGNACGTTTLAEIMSYLGVPQTQADTDNAIRKMNIFTAPDDMIQYARDHGLEAEGYNNGSWDEVKAMLDAGHPVQAMVNGDSSVPVTSGSSASTFSVDGLHYIAITGHGTDPVTGEEYVTYHDPNRGTEQKMSVSDFEKMWGNINLGGLSGGFKNYFIAYAPTGTKLPDGRDDGIQGTQGTLNGVANITNGLSRIYPAQSVGSEMRGICDVFGGAFQTVFCGVSAGLQMGASWLNNEVEGIPVLQNLVQPLGDIVNGAGAAVADVFNGLGESFDDTGAAFEKLCDGDFKGFAEGLGDAAGDAIKGATDAVTDAVSSVGDAVGDFFSGW